MDALSAADFEKGLYSESGLQPLANPPVVLIGLVKRSNSGPGLILFSPGYTCFQWIPIPTSMIDRIERLGIVPCGGHEHEYVRIHLKQPQSPESMGYVEVLRAYADVQMGLVANEPTSACGNWRWYGWYWIRDEPSTRYRNGVVYACSAQDAMTSGSFALRNWLEANWAGKWIRMAINNVVKESRSESPADSPTARDIGKCEVLNCTCKKFKPTSGGSIDICKTCTHRDVDHSID